MGTAGRDFHNFDTAFRDHSASRVAAFTDLPFYRPDLEDCLRGF